MKDNIVDDVGIINIILFCFVQHTIIKDHLVPPMVVTLSILRTGVHIIWTMRMLVSRWRHPIHGHGIF